MSQSEPPFAIMIFSADERAKRLLRQVWRRLPAYDRAMLRALVMDVTLTRAEEEGQLGAARVIHNTPADGNVGEIAKTSERTTVTLPGLADMPDAPAMFVIAHEFAHVVLRHNQLGAVSEFLGELSWSPYTAADLDAIYEMHEDAADLLAYAWGFEAELAAFLAAYPTARRPRWYTELGWQREAEALHGSSDSLR